MTAVKVTRGDTCGVCLLVGGGGSGQCCDCNKSPSVPPSPPDLQDISRPSKDLSHTDITPPRKLFVCFLENKNLYYPIVSL